VTPDQHHAQVHRFDGPDHSYLAVSSPSTGDVLAYSSGSWVNRPLMSAVAVLIDGGGQAPGTGTVGWVAVPFTAQVTSWTLLADTSGSAVLDVLRCAFADFPAGAQSMAGSARPSLSGSDKAQGDTSGWLSSSISAGDILIFQVVSANGLTRLSLTLTLRRL
jgi:hypothetical protein